MGVRSNIHKSILVSCFMSALLSTGVVLQDMGIFVAMTLSHVCVMGERRAFVLPCIMP